MAHQGPAQPQHPGDRLPKAGAWLNCSPLPALGLHLRGAEFVVACKFRLGLPVKSWAIHGQLYQVRATIIALFLKIVERSM